MSIRVGYSNDKYSYDNLNNYNNILRLNSFNDSNMIVFNHDASSLKEAFINFKNVISTGLSYSNYLFKDIHGNSNIMSINSCNILLDKPVTVQKELYIDDVFHTSNGNTVLNSNVEFHLIDPSNTFSIFSSNDMSKIHFTTNDFEILDTYGSNRINITDSQIDMNSNVFISNGTLFVDKISSIGPNLNIENASYSSTTFESMISIESIDIINKQSGADKIAFSIFKNYGDTDLLSLNTCNTIDNTITNNFTINNNGLIGIGTDNPSASLNIRNASDNIILYEGVRTGDVFKVTQIGDVGIGVLEPKAQFHIKRNDDSLNPDNDDNRKNPLFICDINYDASLNTSNVYNTNTSIFFPEPVDPDEKMQLYQHGSRQISTSIDPGTLIATTSVTSKYYLLRPEILNKTPGNNIESVLDTNILEFKYPLQTYEFEKSYEVQDNADPPNAKNIKLKAIIYYPKNNNNPVSFEMDIGGISENNSITQALLMNTGAADPVYDLTNELEFNESFDINIDSSVVSVNFNINFNLEASTNYEVEYDVIENILIPCPDFMQMIHNNNFVSSLSASGAFSLGEQMPDTCNHLLYVQGSSMIDTLDINYVYTSEENCNISLLNTNLIEVNKINSVSLDTEHILANYVLSSNISCSNLITSNLTFDTCSNEYLSFSNENIHFKTKTTIGDDPLFADNYSTELEIKLSDRVIPIQEYFDRHNGIIVSSDDQSINPCVTIRSEPLSIPIFNMNNTDKSYNFRIKKTINETNKSQTRFQFMSDNISQSSFIYYVDDNHLPSLIQHTFDETKLDDGGENVTIDSTLSFGDQSIICIDCKNKREHDNSFQYNNYSSKISMGMPYGVSGINEKTFITNTFTSSAMKDKQYLLNVYGNVSISDICEYPMITMKSLETSIDADPSNHKDPKDRDIYLAINGEPDLAHNLCVHGDIACDEIRTSNKLYVPIFDSSDNIIQHRDLIDLIRSSQSWEIFKSHFPAPPA